MQSVINYQPGDVIHSGYTSSRSSGVWNKEDWNKAYSDDLKLRMVGTFLYQDENAFTISEQTTQGLNRLVPITCNNFCNLRSRPLRKLSNHDQSAIQVVHLRHIP